MHGYCNLLMDSTSVKENQEIETVVSRGLCEVGLCVCVCGGGDSSQVH